jgi:hypothetical protein
MKMVVDKFNDGDIASAGAVVFWAAPVTLRSNLIFEDHQKARVGVNINKAVIKIIESRCQIITHAGGWKHYTSFNLIHSAEWPQNPRKNMFVLQSNNFGSGVDAEYMVESMKELLALQLMGTLKGSIMMSWPSVMDATREALRWLELYQPEDWTVYLPDRYISESEALAALNAVSGAWVDIWELPGVTASGLNYQLEVSKAYRDNLNSGMDKDAALQAAWHVGRNEMYRKEKDNDITTSGYNDIDTETIPLRRGW